MIRFAIEEGRDTFTGETIWQIVEIATGTVFEHYYDPVEAGEVCDFYNDRETAHADDEPWYDAVDADADALASAGWGTDEDYGGGFDDF